MEFVPKKRLLVVAGRGNQELSQEIADLDRAITDGTLAEGVIDIAVRIALEWQRIGRNQQAIAELRDAEASWPWFDRSADAARRREVSTRRVTVLVALSGSFPICSTVASPTPRAERTARVQAHRAPALAALARVAVSSP